MDAKGRLRRLTGKDTVVYARRGNTAIREALRIAKGNGCTRLVIPDQGGWLTYAQFGKKLGFVIEEMRTDDALIRPDMVSGDCSTVLILHSLPAYAFTLDMAAIAKKCKEQGIFLINDVTGSLGTPAATHGDIILGSFGPAKPVPLGTGGFLAADHELSLEEVSLDESSLESLLSSLPRRRNRVLATSRELKALFGDRVLLPEHVGFNVIVPCDEGERESLIKLAADHGAECTVCPRGIRVLRSAVCVEVKRAFRGV